MEHPGMSLIWAQTSHCLRGSSREKYFHDSQELSEAFVVISLDHALQKYAVVTG